MRKVLMVAYHFPPFTGGSGVLRTLKFCKYLPGFGWDPIILTAHPRAYPAVGGGQLGDIPHGVRVHRAFALDTGKHLALRGAYPRIFALPDRWVSWWPVAVLKGWQILKKIKPEVIWSTYPIATAHLIGLTLHRLTGIPWVADFRDSMTEEGYPREKFTRNCYLWIEKKTVEQASKIVFTADSTKDMYLNRYPKLSESRCEVIQNGYDEEDFGFLKNEVATQVSSKVPIRLVHAGLVYPQERNPRPFFKALARLKKEGKILSSALQVELRGAGTEDMYHPLLKELEIDDIIFLLPPLPYRESLEDCLHASAFLVFQGGDCNHQIPAKVYENLRMGKPILALTDHLGETAKLLAHCGGATVLDMADEQIIYEGLPVFIAKVHERKHLLPDRIKVSLFARRSQAQQLAEIFQTVILNAAGRK